MPWFYKIILSALNTNPSLRSVKVLFYFKIHVLNTVLPSPSPHLPDHDTHHPPFKHEKFEDCDFYLGSYPLTMLSKWSHEMWPFPLRRHLNIYWGGPYVWLVVQCITKYVWVFGKSLKYDIYYFLHWVILIQNMMNYSYLG